MHGWMLVQRGESWGQVKKSSRLQKPPFDSTKGDTGARHLSKSVFIIIICHFSSICLEENLDAITLHRGGVVSTPFSTVGDVAPFVSSCPGCKLCPTVSPLSHLSNFNSLSLLPPPPCLCSFPFLHLSIFLSSIPPLQSSRLSSKPSPGPEGWRESSSGCNTVWEL